MISLIEALPVGSATRMILSPPPGAASWQLLRSTSDNLTAPDQPGAVVVEPWGKANAVVDIAGLVDGTPVFYRPFYRDAAGDLIVPLAASRSVTPLATAEDTSTDVLRLVQARFAAGLTVAVRQGRLKPRSGAVRLVLAPFVDPTKAEFPMAHIALESSRPAGFGIGDEFPDELISGVGDDPDTIAETTGTLNDIAINVLGVSNNADERIELGRVLQHIFNANKAVWAAQGLLTPAFALSHTEIETETVGAFLYVAAGTFTCQAPSTTAGDVGLLRSISTTLEIQA